MKFYVPTKKWFTALVTGVAALVTSAIGSGEWGDTENVGLKTLAIALAFAYMKKNDSNLPK